MADFCVCGWMYDSLTDGVLDLTRGPTEQSARELWVAIENLFEENKAPRVIFLSHEFHSLSQGDYSIDDYYLLLKTTIDALRDVGQPVSKSTLVLTLLSGLNK